MRVSEVMTKEVKALSPKMNVKEALEMLLKGKISGLPILDGDSRLLGMFTEKDVLKHILPSYIEQVGRFVYTDDPKGIRSKVLELTRIKVTDIMRKEVITVGEDASLAEVARIMLTQGIRRIPVLNREGKIAGIVAREDIVRALTKD